MQRIALSLQGSGAESCRRRPARDRTRQASCSSTRGPSPPRYLAQRSLSSSGSLSSLVYAVETASRNRVRFGDASSASSTARHHGGGSSFGGGRQGSIESFLETPSSSAYPHFQAEQEDGAEAGRRRQRRRREKHLDGSKHQRQNEHDGWREAGHIIPLKGVRQSFALSSSAISEDSRLVLSSSLRRQLNRKLANSSSFEEALQLCEELHAGFDAINVATALRALARTAGGPSRRVRMNASQSLRLEAALQQLSVLVVSGSVQYEPRTLASCAHSLAKLRCRIPEVWVALGRNATRQVAQLGPQDIANLLWAFATIRYRARPLFRALAAAAALQPEGSFKAQELSIIVWSFATMHHAEPALFDRFAIEAERLAPKMSPQNLANTLWAYAKSGHKAPRLFGALCHQVAARSGALSSQNIANVLWAIAAASLSGNLQLRSAGECEEDTSAEEMQLREVVTILAEEVWARGLDFKAQELSASAWALARLGYRSPAAFHVVSQATIAKAKQLTSQGLATTMWSFASAGHDAPHLFRALTAEFTSRKQRRGPKGSPRDLAMMAWAHATLSYSTSAAEDLMKHIVPRAMELGPHELCNAIWSLAVLGLLEPADLAAFGPALEAKAAEFSPEGLTQLAHADLAVGLATGAPQDMATEPTTLLPLPVANECRTLRRQMLKEEREAQASPFQLALLKCLKHAAATPEATILLREPALNGLVQASISVVLSPNTDTPESRVRRIAIEPEGHSSFTVTEPRRPLGSTMLKRRLLRLAGWEVVSVPFFEWERLCGDKAKADYLRRRMFRQGVSADDK